MSKYKLKDLVIKIASGATPSGGKSSYSKNGVSLIRSQNVLDFTFSIKGLARISDDQANKLSNVIIEPEDVLLNITGDSVARVCQVPNSILPARVNQHVAIIRTQKTKLNPEFLKYYLLNPIFKFNLLSLSSAGATRQALTKRMIEELELTIPPITFQLVIIKILSSLDNKIELNLQMNKTLEAIAQAIFKEWFIDFLFPGFDGELVDGLPKGWRQGNYLDLAKIETGKGLKRREYVSDGQYSVRGANGEIGKTDKYLYDNSLILTGRVGTLGQIKISNGKCWISDNVLISKPYHYFFYTYFVLKTINLIALNRGSTQPLITQTDLKNQSVVIPDEITLSFFEGLISCLYRKIDTNDIQNQTLRQLRDALLPKLMTGKIRV